MTAELHATVATRLQGVEQRYTRGRRDLVAVLAGADRPLTISEIVEAGDGLAQSSVYRNLAVMENAGVVQRLTGADEFARYELAEDLTEHHHHLVCRKCGMVADYTMTPALERSMAKAIERIAEETGWAPAQHELDLVGLCPNCQ